MSSIEVEPIDGPDEPVPVDGLAAELTNSVGVPNDAGPDDAVPNALADEVEEYSAHAEQRDRHLAEDGEGEQVDEQGGPRVPLGALHRERARHQQAKAQIAQLQAQLAAHQQQVAQFQQWQQQLAAQQQQAQQQAQVPAFEEDPEAHIAARFAQIEQHIAGQQQAAVQRQHIEQAATQVQHELTQAAPIVTQLEAEFAAQHPDYHQAYAHLDREVDARIAAQRPGASPEQRAFAKQLATLQFVQYCASTGQNPAQLIYSRAADLGYQTQHRAPSMKRAPTSLGALPGGGRAPDEQGRLSASQVSQMSDAEFNALFESMRDGAAPRFGF
ncbi:MAG: hypothetical protein PBV00_11490 [Pseudomonas asiatica]